MKKYLETTKPNYFLKIEVVYNLGGMNYFTSNAEERGYYLSVTPVEKCEHSECYRWFTGIKDLLLSVNRKSDKSYNKALELAKNKEQELINYVLDKNNLTLKEN